MEDLSFEQLKTGVFEKDGQAGSDQFCEITPERINIPLFTMVIFGGTGDLCRRKLMPTLYHLCIDQNLPDDFSIIGFASSKRSDEEYRELMKKAIRDFSEDTFSMERWDKFSRHLYYVQGNFEDNNSYKKLSERLDELTKPSGKDAREIIFYLAVPPNSLSDIVERLSFCKLCKGIFNTRLIVEKPFGRDRTSASELNKLIASGFDESQVYRIDHYLGKETVQNIIFFRFANSIFEPLWNRRYIDHVQITVAESLGIEHRGRFYEESGVIRDIVQNHMMQLLALVAMEPPIGFEADFIRDEKIKVYRIIRPMDEKYIDEFTVRGQYRAGKVNGREAPGYRDEKDTAEDSDIPTYFAAKFYIDSWRWAGVPFYLRTGKRMTKRVTEISIFFKQPPLRLFSASCEIIEPNILVLGIQPHEEISLRFGVKRPGIGNQLYPVNMTFNYEKDIKGNVHFPLPYERLLIDCIKGDQSLFARQDGIEAMWTVVDPIIDRWENTPASAFPNYSAGTWGPKEADDMMSREGRYWQTW